MFATVGIALLLVVRGLRPQEVVVALQPLPLVPLVFALALFGLVVDLKLRKAQLIAAPQLGWAIAFVACALVALAVARPPGARIEAAELVAGFATFFLLAQGVQRFRALALVAAILLALALVSAVVAMRPPSTLAAALGDPDARALTPALAVPLAFAFFERKRSATRGFLSIVTLLVVGLCVILTQSRAGQLVLAAELVVYFGLRLGLRGLLVGAVLAAPLFCVHVRGGLARHGAPAGLVGLAAALAVLYLSFKTAVVVLVRYRNNRDAAAACAWARALLAALAGLTVGLFFVPPGRGTTFWIYTGLAGALYQAARAHDPKLTRPVVLIRF